jgi:cytochrome c oxidase subunit 2
MRAGVWGLAVVCVVALAVRPAPSDEAEDVIRISAEKFDYTPSEITIKKGVPVVLELTSGDIPHGFTIPELKIRADVRPGIVTRMRIVAQRTGRLAFHCDVFCGHGHEEMTGTLVVVD